MASKHHRYEALRRFMLRPAVLMVYGLMLIAIPVTLWILPPDFFDEGQSLCVSVLLFDTPCYGCGLTRGVQHLLHLDFETAARYNILSFMMLPLMMIVWFIEIKRVVLLLAKYQNTISRGSNF